MIRQLGARVTFGVLCVMVFLGVFLGMNSLITPSWQTQQMTNQEVFHTDCYCQYACHCEGSGACQTVSKGKTEVSLKEAVCYPPKPVVFVEAVSSQWFLLPLEIRVEIPLLMSLLRFEEEPLVYVYQVLIGFDKPPPYICI